MAARMLLALQDANGQVIGAQCRDTITGRKFEVHAKVVINAAGAGGAAGRRHFDRLGLRNRGQSPLLLFVSLFVSRQLPCMSCGTMSLHICRLSCRPQLQTPESAIAATYEKRQNRAAEEYTNVCLILVDACLLCCRPLGGQGAPAGQQQARHKRSDHQQRGPHHPARVVRLPCDRHDRAKDKGEQGAQLCRVAARVLTRKNHAQGLFEAYVQGDVSLMIPGLWRHVHECQQHQWGISDLST